VLRSLTPAVLLAACASPAVVDGGTAGGSTAGGATAGGATAGGATAGGGAGGSAGGAASCPMPTGNTNGWAPDWSPDGCSLASGLGSVWVNGVQVANPGWYPVWVSSTRIVFNGMRANGEGLRESLAPFTSARDVDTPAAFTTFGGVTKVDAAAGLFAAYQAAADHPVLTSAGHRFAQRMAPAVSASDGALAMIARDDRSLYLAVNGQETNFTTEPMGVVTLDVQGDWVVWQVATATGFRTRAYRRSTGALSDVTASNRTHEFFPVLVPVGADMWLMSFDNGGAPDRLYLRPIGETNAIVVASGEIRFPAARWHAASNRIRVAWSNETGASRLAEIDPAAARQPLP